MLLDEGVNHCNAPLSIAIWKECNINATLFKNRPFNFYTRLVPQIKAERMEDIKSNGEALRRKIHTAFQTVLPSHWSPWLRLRTNPQPLTPPFCACVIRAASFVSMMMLIATWIWNQCKIWNPVRSDIHMHVVSQNISHPCRGRYLLFTVI